MKRSEGERAFAREVRAVKKKIRKPYADELRGRESAAPVIEANQILDINHSARIVAASMAFPIFQQFHFFGEGGFFESKVQFDTDMPLLPMQMSPLFGMAVAELAITFYGHVAGDSLPDATFLDLGGGRGYLDYDILLHLTALERRKEDTGEWHMALQDRARFIFSDITENGLSQMRTELSDWLSDPVYGPRISIQEIDATRFQLERSPFGIVYSNELVDAMPSDFVFVHNDRILTERIVAYERGTDPAKILTAFRNGSVHPGVISDLEAFLKEKSPSSVRFMPVFLPIDANPSLSKNAMRLDCVGNATTEPFGGIYPIHLGVAGMLKSIRDSFEHGVVIVIDYISFDEGHHNYDIAVNQIPHIRFGQQDVDVQIDSDQVIEMGSLMGFSLIGKYNLGKYLKDVLEIAHPSPYHMARWAKVHGRPLDEATALGMVASYAFDEVVAQGYDVIVLGF